MCTSRHSPFGSKPFASLAIPFVAAAVLVMLGSPVWAQNPPAGPARPPVAPAQPAPSQPAVGPKDYAPLTINADLRNSRNEIQGYLRDGAVPPNAQAKFREYYEKYALARWTDPALLPELEKKPNFNLPDCRRELSNDLMLGRNGPVHDELAQLALEFLDPLASDGTRHPASRCNAMLAIGDLNKIEFRSPSDPKAPWPDALPVLLRAFTDPNQIDAVRLAALIGVFRHAVLEGDNYRIQDRDKVRDQLLKLAETKEDPRRSAQGQVWFRSRAMDVLGALKDPGPQNSVVKALATIVADREEDLLARRAAARALGRLSVPSGQGLDSSQMGAALGQLAADASAAELARMEEEAAQKPRGPRGPMGMPGYMGGGDYMPSMSEEESGSGYRGAPTYPGSYDEEGPMMPPGMGSSYGPYGQKKPEEQPDETLNNRRRLKSFLNAAFLGLAGVDWPDWAEWVRNNPNAGVLAPGGAARLATAQGQGEFVKGLMTQVDGLSKLCDNKDKLEREKWIAELETQLGNLTQALGAVSAPPASPPPGAGQPAGTAPPTAPPPGAVPAGTPPAGAGQPAGTAPPTAPPPGTAPAGSPPAGAGQPAGTATPPAAPAKTATPPAGSP